jgi:hypothetical protein
MNSNIGKSPIIAAMSLAAAAASASGNCDTRKIDWFYNPPLRYVESRTFTPIQFAACSHQRFNQRKFRKARRQAFAAGKRNAFFK